MTNIEQSNEKRQRSQAVTQTEWEQYMAEKILRLIRHELYMDFRYMDVALSALSYQPKEGIDTLGTEGDHLFYSADHLLRVYPKNPVYLNRCYLHMILHLIFCHPWLQGSRNAADWDLACDIMIEYLIDHMEQTSVQRITGVCSAEKYINGWSPWDRHYQRQLFMNRSVCGMNLIWRNLAKNFIRIRMRFGHDHSPSRPFLCRFRRNGTNWHDRHRCRWNGRAETMAMKKD